MVFKGCQRCRGDLWVEEDIGSRLEDLVCLQCGHRQPVQAAGLGPSVEDLTRRRRPAPDRRSRIATITSEPGVAGDKTISGSSQHRERTLGWPPALINDEVQMSEVGTERLLTFVKQDLPEYRGT